MMTFDVVATYCCMCDGGMRVHLCLSLSLSVPYRGEGDDGRGQGGGCEAGHVGHDVAVGLVIPIVGTGANNDGTAALVGCRAALGAAKRRAAGELGGELCGCDGSHYVEQLSVDDCCFAFSGDACVCVCLCGVVDGGGRGQEVPLTKKASLFQLSQKKNFWQNCQLCKKAPGLAGKLPD